MKLIETTRNSFFCGVEALKIGNRIGDVGHAIQSCVEKEGFSVVRKYIGHGVGQQLHEEPDVPNYGTPGRGLRLSSGMTIAIEPMVCENSGEVKVLPDGWTVVTADGGLSAHYEHTVAITDNGVIVLTKVD